MGREKCVFLILLHIDRTGVRFEPLANGSWKEMGVDQAGWGIH